MKIGQKFNQLTQKEYFFYIDNYKKYTDFNTLGLYRSILENEKISLEEKIAVREYAHKTFQKFFNFLQVKDPDTFIKVSTLGQILTRLEEKQLLSVIEENQEKILKAKRIKHRNFGTYSKHLSCVATCPYIGVMFKQGSHLTNGKRKYKLNFIKKTKRQKQAGKKEKIWKLLEE